MPSRYHSCWSGLTPTTSRIVPIVRLRCTRSRGLTVAVYLYGQRLSRVPPRRSRARFGLGPGCVAPTRSSLYEVLRLTAPVPCVYCDMFKPKRPAVSVERDDRPLPSRYHSCWLAAREPTSARCRIDGFMHPITEATRCDVLNRSAVPCSTAPLPGELQTSHRLRCTVPQLSVSRFALLILILAFFVMH